MAEFVRAEISEELRKRWNIEGYDWLHLCIGGVVITDSLFRKGGNGHDFKDGYALMLRYRGAFYPDEVTKDPKLKAHLEGRWCIIDEEGAVKVVADYLSGLYILGKAVCVIESYSKVHTYINIETGFKYGTTERAVRSKNYSAIQVYDTDLRDDKIVLINKETGEYETYQ